MHLQCGSWPNTAGGEDGDQGEPLFLLFGCHINVFSFGVGHFSVDLGVVGFVYLKVVLFWICLEVFC